jgi:hypothetical protein
MALKQDQSVPFVMPEIAIVRDEWYVVIETDLRDEGIGDFGFMARADHVRAKLACPSPVTFRDLEQRQTGKHRRSLFTESIAQDLGEHDRRQNHAPMIDRLHDKNNVDAR